MTSKNRLSYLRKEKGKYAYSTENRIFVWKNIIWPLLLEVNRPWFTLKEYRTKRDEVSDTNHIPKEKIGKGKYVVAEYEKIKRITMPLDDNHILYVTTEVNADHDKIIKSVMK